MDGHAINTAEEVVQREVQSLPNQARAAVHMALVGIERDEPPLDDVQVPWVQAQDDLAQRDCELLQVEAIHREVRQVAHLAPAQRPIVGLETHDDVLVGEPGLSRNEDRIKVEPAESHRPSMIYQIAVGATGTAESGDPWTGGHGAAATPKMPFRRTGLQSGSSSSRRPITPRRKRGSLGSSGSATVRPRAADS